LFQEIIPAAHSAIVDYHAKQPSVTVPPLFDKVVALDTKVRNFLNPKKGPSLLWIPLLVFIHF
jgi:hypothetical protein